MLQQTQGAHQFDEMITKDRETLQKLIAAIKVYKQNSVFTQDLVTMLGDNDGCLVEEDKYSSKRDPKTFQGISDDDLRVYTEFLNEFEFNGKKYSQDKGALAELGRRMESKGLHIAIPQPTSGSAPTTHREKENKTPRSGANSPADSPRSMGAGSDDDETQDAGSDDESKKRERSSRGDGTRHHHRKHRKKDGLNVAVIASSSNSVEASATSSTAMQNWSFADFCTPKVVGVTLIVASIAIKFAMDYLNRTPQAQNLQR